MTGKWRAPLWVTILVVPVALLIGLFGLYMLFIAFMLGVVGAEFDHGGAEITSLGVVSVLVSGFLLWVHARIGEALNR